MSRQVIEQDTLRYKEWAEYKVHENVCGKIKDGAGWSDPDHKTAYTGGIPFPWFGNKLFIYIDPMGLPYRTGRRSGSGKSNVHFPLAGMAKEPMQPVRKTYFQNWRSRHFDVFDHVGHRFSDLQ